MREIYYAIYKSATMDVVLNTLIAESVHRHQVKCTEKHIKLLPDNVLSESERAVLHRIYFGEMSDFKLKQIVELSDYYLSMCAEEGYLKKWFLLGYKNTRLFKKEISLNLNVTFNKNIIDYIDTRDINHLKHIIHSIDQVMYPVLNSQESTGIGIYKDVESMQLDAINITSGINLF